MPFPVAAADAFAERRHAIEHGMDVGNYILSVDQDFFPTRRAQGHVQHCALLGRIDLVAAPHRLDTLTHTAFIGQREQQAQRFVGNPVFGVVQIQACTFGRQALAALRIGVEQVAQACAADRVVMSDERLPGRLVEQV